MKNELEKRTNKKCWIEDDSANDGNELNTKTKQAIDQASCVLICMTEKYNKNVSCKYEAEYTVAKKKPFVPLLIQRSFQPKGW